MIAKRKSWSCASLGLDGKSGSKPAKSRSSVPATGAGASDLKQSRRSDARLSTIDSRTYNIMPFDEKQLQQIARRLQVDITDYALLRQALTHRSYLGESAEAMSNERLEFLGDSVLGIVVSEYLYTQFSDRSEGELAKAKAVAVSEPVLAESAKNLGLQEMILMSPARRRVEAESGSRSSRTRSRRLSPSSTSTAACRRPGSSSCARSNPSSRTSNARNTSAIIRPSCRNIRRESIRKLRHTS